MGGASEADYTLKQPADLLTFQQGWHKTEGITASADKFTTHMKVKVSSDWTLTSEYGEKLSYYFSDSQGGDPVTSWDFSATELHAEGGASREVWAFLDDSIELRPGNYDTILTFLVSPIVDLSKLTADYTVKDGYTLTGILPSDGWKITIADGATVTLWSADITSIPNDESHKYAGITCAGNVTLILFGDNKVKGGYEDYPGIFAAENSTLTIKGTGSLTASSNKYGAGIGGGNEISCGNIEIQGGNITATCAYYSAGIGSGYNQASCGNITITGRTVEATGGYGGAGIGSATGAVCGAITIASSVTSVTATKGSESPNSIGAGHVAQCGTVTIGGVVGAISTSPYTYTPGN